MGRKRKNESSEERMHRKIREYQDRLNKKRRCDSVVAVAPIDSNISNAINGENNDVTELRSNGYEESTRYYYEDEELGQYEDLHLMSLAGDNSFQSHAIDSVDVAVSDAVLTAMPAGQAPQLSVVAIPAVDNAATAAVSQVFSSAACDPEIEQAQATTNTDTAVIPTTTAPAAPIEPALDGFLLSLLGDAPRAEVELGPPIHNDISLRWHEILTKGLKEETKNKIIDDYAIPINLEKIIPPILNAEVISALALTPSPVKRDFALQQRQKQIGSALAALGKTLTTLLTDKCLTAPESAIKPLSDGCRLLCELFYSETRTRRGFIISSINSQMKEQLIETTAGKFLFGENLAERLKTAQNIHRSGNILQPLQYKPDFSRNSNYLNSRTPYRRPAATAAAASRPEAGRFVRSARARPPLPPTQSATRGGYRPQQSRRPPPAPQRQQYRGPAPPPFQRRR